MNPGDQNNIFQEAMATYHITPSNPLAYQEGLSFKELLSNKMLLVKAIKEGLTFKFFDLLRSKMPFSEQDWASFLNVSEKTIQRHSAKPSHRFKPIHSEKILELAEVTYYGFEVFGSRLEFEKWLQEPVIALGNMAPKELLSNSYGKELVLAQLNRIEHGIFA
jgi:putative toxin-antitoxin system antitoxin component (TIGR02293 family)